MNSIKKFQHLILTKFNVISEVVKKDKFGNSVNTDEWMEHRIKLFNMFCFPSIKNQTELNFKWLVFFDETTPEKYRSFIRNWRSSFVNFVPVFTNSVNLMSDLQQFIDKDTDFLITSRIDNDDAFHEDAVKVIQSNFQEQECNFLNFLKGFRLNISSLKINENSNSDTNKLKHFQRELKRQGYKILNFLVGVKIDKNNKNKLFLCKAPSNPFITLIEKRTENTFRTVWCTEHGMAKNIGPIRNITDRPYWLQVIHDRNISNSGEGRPYPLDALKNYFHINWNLE